MDQETCRFLEAAQMGGGLECDSCGCLSSAALRLSHCRICRRKHYCSKECQKMDWVTHKAICRPPKDFRFQDIVAVRCPAVMGPAGNPGMGLLKDILVVLGPAAPQSSGAATEDAKDEQRGASLTPSQGKRWNVTFYGAYIGPSIELLGRPPGQRLGTSFYFTLHEDDIRLLMPAEERLQRPSPYN